MAIQTYDEARHERAEHMRRELPMLVQQIALDLKRKLAWAPYLSAAPSAICVMATCLVAGKSPQTARIKVTIPPFELNGVQIEPRKFLGTNLQYCSELGRKAFDRAEQGMRKLEDDAAFVVGATGPLAQIISVLNDSKPEYSTLDMWMQQLGGMAKACEDEASAMKVEFEALLEFIVRLKLASIEALNANQTQLNEEQEIEATKDAEESRYDQEILQAGIARDELQSELEEEKRNLQRAQDKMKLALRGNGCEDTQTKIDDISAELRRIEAVSPESASWASAPFRYVFGKARKLRKERESRKELLTEQLNELLERRAKLISHSQACAVQEMEARQRTVEGVEKRLLTARDMHTKLLEERFQAVKDFKKASADLGRLSDTTLDLKAINEILLNSINTLKDLNNYIRTMTDFFIEASRYVDDTMRVRLGQFNKQKKSVEDGEKSRTAEESSKHRTLAILTTLDLHGRFSVIHDLAGIYVMVSRGHIKPGFEKMDNLTYSLNEYDFQQEMEEFGQWGDRATKGIKSLATEENMKIEETLFRGMASLVRKQIDFED